MGKSNKKAVRLLLVLYFLIGMNTIGADRSLIGNTSRAEIKKRYGSFAVNRIEAAKRITKKIVRLSDKKKLTTVNKFVNKVRFVSDMNAWGVKDYWAKPVEFLGRNKGDCEDFVITKYIMLRKAKISGEKLFFTYVKALRLNQAHMVLTYYATPKSIPLVLDNLNPKVLPASKRNDLAFVYSFNAKKLYLNRQKGLGKIVPGGRDKNKKWSMFLENIEKEFK